MSNKSKSTISHRRCPGGVSLTALQIIFQYMIQIPTNLNWSKLPLL